MNDPIRLLDEAPASELSSALAAERTLTATLDGSALKGRVLAQVAAGAVPSALSVAASTWTSTALPVALAGLLGVGAGVLGTLAVVDRAPPPAPPASPPPSSSAALPPLPPPREPEGAAAVRPLTPPPAHPPPRPEPGPQARPSSLVDETRRYERAEAALREGRPMVAVDELRGYLRAYPTGALRDEARLSLLEAYMATQRFDDARDLARGLVADEGLRDRRREILRVLVQAELQLRECEQAARDLQELGADAPRDMRDAIARCEGADREPRSDGSGANRE